MAAGQGSCGWKAPPTRSACTNTADGILLCKHQHLLHHNNGWEISRDSTGNYWLSKPANTDQTKHPSCSNKVARCTT
jgi:hypothetical protein